MKIVFSKSGLLLSVIAACMVTSCKDKDVYDAEEAERLRFLQANNFNFSTAQMVKLDVDYSAYETHGPVFFSVYNEDPFEGESEGIRLRENVKPMFESYTDAEGRFSQKVELPAYAKDLYVVTGNFFVANSKIKTTIDEGVAEAVAVNFTKEAAAARAQRPVFKAAAMTNSLARFYHLSNEVDVYTGDDKGVQVYPEWITPLGRWDSESGRPEYLLDKNTANANLFFTEEEMEKMYQTVSGVLVANQTCNEIYRIQADLTLERASEVAITFLGSMTCWNNTLGYYYYTDEPQSRNDLHVIMLFPNTQDGYWVRDWCKRPNFYGNIALERGDAVQLMYYPNIANNDTTGATKIFPKGTKIGFLLKPNGWGMQNTNGDKKFYNSYKGDGDLKVTGNKVSRQYNVWASSTNGLSYCDESQIKNDKGAIAIPNPNGDSRTAKFVYKSDEGDEYAIVSFEDACNDLDFDDIIFALKPISAFTQLPTVENKKTSVNKVYAFEDLWPNKGDYDMNDAMVELTQEKEFSKLSNEKEYKVYKQTFALKTDQNYVTKVSGLALELNAKSKPTSIVMKMVKPESNDTVDADFTKDGNVYLLTDNIHRDLKTTFILELNYENGIKNDENVASVKPFIYRAQENNKRWEVHIPFEVPTAKVDTTYFGKQDDRSVPAEERYYVREGNYPFAFCLMGVTLDNFKETLLKRENESIRIDELYPEFLEWSVSKGAVNTDWYLHPKGEMNKQD